MSIDHSIPSSQAGEARFSQSSADLIASLFRDRRFVLIGGLIIGVIVALAVALLGNAAALALILAVEIGIIALMKPELTTVFIAFAVYLNLPVVAIRYAGVPPAVAGATVLALGLPLFHALFVRRQRLIVTSGFVLMTAYLAVILLSAVFSPNYTQSIERIVSFVLEGYVLYFLFTNTIRTPETVKRIIWALIVAGAIMGSLSMIQEITGNYENEFFGLAQTKDAELNVGTGTLFDAAPTARRLAGPIGSKNRYAQIMLVLLPIAVMQIYASTRRSAKLFAAAALIPIVGGVLLTYSRGGGVTLIAILVALMFMRILPVWKTIAIAVLSYALILLFLPGFAYRFASILDVAALFSENADEADGAIRGRATVNLVGLQIIANNPLLGVGPGRSPLYTQEIGNEIGFRHLESDRRLHNMYLEEAADTGLIGFAFFMSIVLVTLARLNAARNHFRERNKEYYYLLVGLMLAIYSYLVMAVFLHLSYVRYYWFLLALGGAAAYVLLKQPGTEQTDDTAALP